MSQASPMTNAFMVSVQDIEVSNRARKEFKKGPMDSLRESIAQHGIIEPLVVEPSDNESKPYRLVAGERRFRAALFQMPPLPEVPCILRADLDGQQAREIELDENIQREGLEWQERVALTAEIDKLKREKAEAQGEKWTTEQTAEVTGLKRAAAFRHKQLAKTLEERPDLATRTKNMPMPTAQRVIKQVLETERTERLAKEGKLTLTEGLQLGSCLDLIKQVDTDSVDLVIMDPPYGNPEIEAQAGKSQGASVTYTAVLKDTDNLSESAANILVLDLLKGLSRVLKPSCHIYCFHTIDRLWRWTQDFKLYDFIMNPVPLIWQKGSAASVFKGYEFPSDYEPIMFGHCEEKTKRLMASCRATLEFKPIPAQQKLHPFEKPQGLLRYLISQSSMKGELVLDPFAGSGATLLAARDTGRSYLGFELDKEHFLKAQARLTEEPKGDTSV